MSAPLRPPVICRSSWAFLGVWVPLHPYPLAIGFSPHGVSVSVFTLLTKKPVILKEGPVPLYHNLIFASAVLLDLLKRMIPSEAIDVQPSAYELGNAV